MIIKFKFNKTVIKENGFWVKTEFNELLYKHHVYLRTFVAYGEVFPARNLRI